MSERIRRHESCSIVYRPETVESETAAGLQGRSTVFWVLFARHMGVRSLTLGSDRAIMREPSMRMALERSNQCF